jgi:hypothetical protein
MKFKKAVESGILPIRQGYRSGLTALGVYSKKVTCQDSRRLTGSIALDEAYKVLCPTSHRWDYGVGYITPEQKEVAIWVEIHPAETSEIMVLIQKLKWLKSLLSAPENSGLKELTRAADKPFHWIASHGVDLRPTTKQEKMLRMEGLDSPKGYLQLR